MPPLPLSIEYPEKFYRGVLNGLWMTIPLWMLVIVCAWQIWAWAYAGT